MKIDFVNKINKEYNSLTTLLLGDKEFPLTEKELVELLRIFYNKREDVFNSEGFNPADASEFADLKEEVEDLRQRNSELEKENDDLQDEIDDLIRED